MAGIVDDYVVKIVLSSPATAAAATVPIAPKYHKGRSTKRKCTGKYCAFVISVGMLSIWLLYTFSATLLVSFVSNDDNNHDVGADSTIPKIQQHPNVHTLQGIYQKRKDDNDQVDAHQETRKPPPVRPKLSEMEEGLYKMALELVLNEISKPLNDYMWQLTLDITNGTFDSVTNKKFIDGPKRTSEIWELKTLNLDDILQKTVLNHLQIEVIVKNTVKYYPGSSSISDNNNPRYESFLKNIITRALSDVMNKILMRSSDYRCCCQPWLSDLQNPRRAMPTTENVGSSSNNNNNIIMKTQCSRKSGDSKETVEEELLYFGEHKATIQSEEKILYCRIQHVGSTTATASALLLQFGAPTKFMQLVGSKYKCTLQFMMDDSIKEDVIAWLERNA